MTWGRWLRRAISVHRGRFIFATVSVVLGVTAFVGVSVGTGTLSQALELGQAARLADQNPDTRHVYLVPTGVWGARGPRAEAEAIGDLRDVVRVVPGLGFSTPLSEGDIGFVYGQPRGSGLRATQGRLPTTGADEVVVGERTLARAGWALDNTVQLEGPAGSFAATIVGLFEGDGSIVTSLPTAQRWAGAGDTVDGVDVVVRRGVDANDWARAHARETGTFQAAAVTLFDTDSIAFFRSIERSVTPIATAALVLGAFLIYLTISRTVQDRQRDHAALRAVGATRRRVLALVLAEAALVGVVGTIIGIAFGLVVARGVSNLMSGVFAVDIAIVPDVNAPSSVLIQAVLLGMAAPLIAAAAPAIKAGREDPAILLRGETREAPPTLRLAFVGVGVFAAGLAVTVGVGENTKAFGSAITFVGLVMSGPLLTSMVGRGLQVLARRVSSSGELAAQRIARKPGRSARTAALLATTLSMIVVLLIIGASGRVGFVRIVNANIDGDLWVSTRYGKWLTPEQLREVRGRPEVTAATGVAEGSVRTLGRGGREEFLTVIDPDTYFGVADFAWTRATNPDAARAALSRPGNVLLATAISHRLHKRIGDAVTIQTQHGRHQFRVAGTYAGLDRGNTRAVVVSTADAREWFGYRGDTDVLLRTAPGAAFGLGAALSNSPLQLHYQLRALTRESYVDGFDSAWVMVTLTGVIASGIGLMGLINTMVMEVVDRRHEIGVMRAVGAHRRDVRRVVSLEGLGFGVMAGVVGLVAGSLAGRATMTGVAVETEVALAFRYSAVAVPLVLALALLAGTLAGRIPARRAAAVEPAIVLRSL